MFSSFYHRYKKEKIGLKEVYISYPYFKIFMKFYKTFLRKKLER